MAYRDLPEGPITDLGTSGPGYYQTRGIGNKTGRVSPRQQIRGSARDKTLAQHGLIDAGAAEPQQGQLFDTGPRPSNADVIREQGLNMPTGMTYVKPSGKTQDLQFGGARGYLPNLDTKQKVNALASVQEGRVKQGTDRGTGAPTAEIMQDREAVRAKAPNQSWYAGVDDRGSHETFVEGEAHKAISSRAARSNAGSDAMTRATAITSPQSTWDLGTKGSPDYRMPNLNHAEQVVRATDIAKPYMDKAEIMEVGSEIEVADGGLPLMGAKAAGVRYDAGEDVRKGIEVKSHTSQKAPNFEASLRSSDPSNVVRGMAAESWTADRHDATASGVHKSLLENRVGVYDVLAMTGTRTAFKNRELPPNEQAREWVGTRPEGSVNSPEHGMFDWSNRKKTYEVKKGLEARTTGSSGSRAQRRSGPRDIASDLDLEF